MKQYNRILFVAENGTCRAPMAAGILGEYVLKHPVEIGARGMIVLFPEPLNQKAEAVMISNGINLEGYMSAQLTEEDFTEDTLVLVMEHAQLEKVLEKYERANPENVYVLTELVGDELEILDPYGGSLQAYGLCYETMRKTIKKLVTLLNEESNEGSGEKKKKKNRSNGSSVDPAQNRYHPQRRNRIKRFPYISQRDCNADVL